MKIYELSRMKTLSARHVNPKQSLFLSVYAVRSRIDLCRPHQCSMQILPKCLPLAKKSRAGRNSSKVNTRLIAG